MRSGRWCKTKSRYKRCPRAILLSALTLPPALFAHLFRLLFLSSEFVTAPTNGSCVSSWQQQVFFNFFARLGFNFLPSILLRNRPHSLTSVPETKGTNICTFSPSSWASSASSAKSTAWSSASSWYQVTKSSLGVDQLIGQWFLHKMKNRLRFPATRGCSSQKSLTGNESIISPATRGIALWLNSARLTKSQQKALSVAKKGVSVHPWAPCPPPSRNIETHVPRESFLLSVVGPLLLSCGCPLRVVLSAWSLLSQNGYGNSFLNEKITFHDSLYWKKIVNIMEKTLLS